MSCLKKAFLSGKQYFSQKNEIQKNFDTCEINFEIIFGFENEQNEFFKFFWKRSFDFEGGNGQF